MLLPFPLINCFAVTNVVVVVVDGDSVAVFVVDDVTTLLLNVVDIFASVVVGAFAVACDGVASLTVVVNLDNVTTLLLNAVDIFASVVVVASLLLLSMMLMLLMLLLLLILL